MKLLSMLLSLVLASASSHLCKAEDEAAKDLKLAASDGKPKATQVALCWRPSPGATGLPGHAFVALGTWGKVGGVYKLTEIRGAGFFPKGDGLVSSIISDGVVKNEESQEVIKTAFLFHETPGASLPPRSCRVLVHVDQAKKKEIEDLITSWNQETYVLGFNDCVKKVDDVAKLLGLERPPLNTPTMPETYIKRIYDLNTDMTPVIP